MKATPPPLAADLDAGLRRLRLAAIRRLTPELLVTAKTQRWAPEEFLRTLIEAELASRDASNVRARLKQAAFPVTKTLEEFDVATSSLRRATFDYLASLEWVAARENLCLVGPAGTGKSHLLVALGHHAVSSGLRARYFTAAELVETLYRGLADNSVGRVIESVLKADLVLIDEIGFAPMDDTGAQLFFRLVAAAYERRSLGIGSHRPFEDWGRFLPEHTTAVSLLDRLLHHSVVVVTDGESFRMKESKARRALSANAMTLLASIAGRASNARPAGGSSSPPSTGSSATRTSGHPGAFATRPAARRPTGDATPASPKTLPAGPKEAATGLSVGHRSTPVRRCPLRKSELKQPRGVGTLPGHQRGLQTGH